MPPRGGRLKVGFYAGLEITEKRTRHISAAAGIGRTFVLSIEGLHQLLFSHRFGLVRLARKERAWNQLLDSAEYSAADFPWLHPFVQSINKKMLQQAQAHHNLLLHFWKLNTLANEWTCRVLHCPFFWAGRAGWVFLECEIKEVGRQSVACSQQACVQICQRWPGLMRGRHHPHLRRYLLNPWQIAEVLSHVVLCTFDGQAMG